MTVPALLDRPAVGSPLYWVEVLSAKIRERRPKLDRLNAYYVGDHPLAFASDKFRSAFGGLFVDFADNWTDLIVDAVEERLNVEGFRFGPDRRGDADAWRIWQANSLDSESQIAHTEALVGAESYALVWADENGDPSITVEHASQVAVAYEAGSRRKRAAALKLWRDDDGFERATLYLPGAIYKFRSATATAYALGAFARWERFEERGEPWPMRNPLGVVPVVPLRNRPRLLAEPVSEIARVIPLQDAVNKTVADMLVASEFGAFRQRWATGIEIPVDPITKQPVEPYKAAVDRVWYNENEQAKFGEFSETNLSNFVAAIEVLVQHIASQTRTPPHYFALTGQFPSGESIKSAETGLVAKVRRKMRHFGESWEEVIRLAFAVLDDPRSEIVDSECIWGDPESRSESEHVDALTKLRAIDVPVEQLWEDAGYSPQQIARFRDMQDETARRSAVADLAALSADAFPPALPAGDETAS